MLRLGHIQYSNCFPVHAALIDERPPAWLLNLGDTPLAEVEIGRRRLAVKKQK